MDTNFKTLQVGDMVMIECYSGLGSGGKSKVTKITTETIANRHKGKLIKDIKMSKVAWIDGQGFDMDTGEAVTEPWAYHMGWVVKRTKK